MPRHSCYYHDGNEDAGNDKKDASRIEIRHCFVEEADA